MTMTSGFFDSVDHDRRYTALQWGQIMDYLINDGVYHIYPETGVRCDENGKFNKTIMPFYVSVVTDKDAYFNPSEPAVSIGPGRAWFDHTWTWVQSPEIVQLPPYNETTDRWDVVVLTMDKSFAQRSNYFRVLQGKPGAATWKDGVTLQGHYMHDDDVHDVPIAYILRTNDPAKKNLEITQLVGTETTPYVANVAEGSFDVSALFTKWQGQWDDKLAQMQKEYEAWHNLFGDVANGNMVEWLAFLDNRAADFMEWLKQYDRAYHVWYQGSVNWTYEYIRNLQEEEKAFSEQWTDAIQRAQELLENGFTEYTQKINEILDKFDNIDNLVEEKMAELQTEIDNAVDEAKNEIQNNVKELMTEVITEQMTTIVEHVVETASPEITDALRADVENLIREELGGSFEERLNKLEEDLATYRDQLLEITNARVDELVNNYLNFQKTIETDVQTYLKEVISRDGTLEEALDAAIQDGLSVAVAKYVESIRPDLVETITAEVIEGVQEQVNQKVTEIFEQRFETEKQELIEYIKAQIPLEVQTAVDTRFNEDFETKYTELAQNIDDHIDTKYQEIKEELASGLATEVDNKVNEAETRINDKITKDTATLQETLTAQVAEDVTTELDTRMPTAKSELKTELKEELSSELGDSVTTQVTSQVTEAKQELSEGLTTEVTNKFNESFDGKYAELEQNINDHIDTKAGEVKQEVHDQLAEELGDSLTTALTQTVTDQVGAAEQRLGDKIDETVQSTFDAQFSDKQAELEGEIQQKIDDGVGSLSGELDTKVNDKFTEVEQGILEKADQAVQDSAKTLNDKIDKALSSVFKPKGTITFEQLPQELNETMSGNVYNVSTEFTTDDRFVEGPGKRYPAGTNIAVVDSEMDAATIALDSKWKFDVMPGFIDLTPYATTASVTALEQQIENVQTSIGNDVDKKLQSINDTLASHESSIGEAASAAEKAQQAADAAQQTADTAQQTADQAKTAASAAGTTAGEAKTAASNAETKAQTAEDTANTANETASAAEKTAKSAESVANEAKTAAEQANTTAGQANTTASQANTTAAAANEAAKSATSTANAAKGVADGALQRSGGTMTGPVYFADSTAVENDSNAQFLLSMSDFSSPGGAKLKYTTLAQFISELIKNQDLINGLKTVLKLDDFLENA